MKLKKYVILLPVILTFFNSFSFAAIPGDANGNGILDLPDAIIILQTMVGLRPAAVNDNSIASTTIVYGNNQTATIGTQLPNPLIAQIMNSAGQPISGQVVNFVVTAGGGSVFASAVTSDANGLVREPWTMGTAAGTQTVEVRGFDSSGNATVYATFTATATAGAPQTISITSGNQQDAQQLQTLPSPVKVTVKDTYGNPVPGIAVTFTAKDGGSALPGSEITNAVGEAATTWTLGLVNGTQGLRAAVGGIYFADFIAFVTLAPPRVTILTGDLQTAEQYSVSLPKPLEVLITDVGGNPIACEATFSTTSKSGYKTSITTATGADGKTNSDSGWNLDSARFYFGDLGEQHVDVEACTDTAVTDRGRDIATLTVEVIPTTHMYDGIYICTGYVKKPLLISDGLIQKFYNFVAPLSPSGFGDATLNEIDGSFVSAYKSSMSSDPCNLTGKIVVDSLQNATATGTGTCTTPSNVIWDIPNWTCNRQ